MTDLRLALTFGDSYAPYPPSLVIGATLAVRMDALDAAGRSYAAAGARIIVRRPDGIGLVFTGGTLTTLGAGAWSAAVGFDQAGTWYIRAETDSPQAEATEIAVPVRASLAVQAGAASPILTTQDLSPVVTQDGKLVTVQRIPSLPAAATLDGTETVLAVQAGAAKQLPVASLTGLAGTAGATAGAPAGAVAGATAGASSGATAGTAAVAAALAPAQYLLRDPAATDDDAHGQRALSVILNQPTGGIWDCLDPATGAAIWVQRSPKVALARQAGKSFWYIAKGRQITTVAPSAGKLYLRKYSITERGQLMSIAVKTAVSLNTAPNTGMKACVFRDVAGRPRDLLSQDTVGASLGTTLAVWYSPQLLAVVPGPIWIGMEFTTQFDAGQSANSLPAMKGADGADGEAESEIGVADINNNLALQGFQVTKTWSASLPTFSSSTDWTALELRGNGMPLPHVQFA